MNKKLSNPLRALVRGAFAVALAVGLMPAAAYADFTPEADGTNAVNVTVASYFEEGCNYVVLDCTGKQAMTSVEKTAYGYLSTLSPSSVEVVNGVLSMQSDYNVADITWTYTANEGLTNYATGKKLEEGTNYMHLRAVGEFASSYYHDWAYQDHALSVNRGNVFVAYYALDSIFTTSEFSPSDPYDDQYLCVWKITSDVNHDGVTGGGTGGGGGGGEDPDPGETPDPGTEGTSITISNPIGGGSDYRIPYNNYDDNALNEIIYTADEIGQSGTITSLAFNVTSVHSSTRNLTSDIKVYMGYKAAGEWAGAGDYMKASDLTLVYDGAKNIGQKVGWENLTLDTPFAYDKDKGNLVVVIGKNSSPNSDLYSTQVTYAYSPAYRTVLQRGSSNDTRYSNVSFTSASMTTSDKRPDVKITFGNEGGTDPDPDDPKTFSVTVSSQDTQGNQVAGGEATGGGEGLAPGQHTVSAQTAVGYAFKGWFAAPYVQGAEPLCTQLSYTFNLAANTSLVAVYEANGKATVSFDFDGLYKVNGQLRSVSSDETFAIGETVSVELMDTENFFCWQNAAGMKVSTKASFTFVATGRETLTPVFNNTAAGAIVVWESAYGQEIQRGQYAEGEQVFAPAKTPSHAGYEFTGWSLTPEQIQAKIAAGETLITVVPVERFSDESFVITVENGKLDNGQTSGVFTPRSIVSAVADPAPEGMVFWCWKSGDDIVSYNKECGFYATGTATITATYVPVEEAVPGASAAITNIARDAEASRLTVSCQFAAGEGVTMRYAGIVATSDTTKAANLTAGNAEYVRGEDASGFTTYRFIWTKTNVAAGDRWYARAYVVYEDELGTHAVYGDIVSWPKN